MADLSSIVAQLEPLLGPLGGEPAPLDGGITNRNYRVELGDAAYVVRLPGRDTGLLGIDREAERLASLAAAKLGISPQIACALDAGLVTRWVEGRPLTEEEAALRADELARMLRAFHDGGPQLPTRFDVPELLDDYAEVVLAHGGTLPAQYDEARALARQIAAGLPHEELAPCHNDLLAGNLLASGERVLLVDWEYAGMGHRMFDLGNLAVNNAFDIDAERRLLRAYFGEEPSPAHHATLRMMRLMSDAREAAWGVVQGAISELDFDFAGYAQRHFSRLREGSADLEEWLVAATG